jgi:hypothetical protein
MSFNKTKVVDINLPPRQSSQKDAKVGNRGLGFAQQRHSTEVYMVTMYFPFSGTILPMSSADSKHD